MRLRLIFLLFFLIPNLLFALSEKECNDKFANAKNARVDAEVNFNKSTASDPNQIDQRIKHLNKAIKVCNDSINEYNAILTDIAKHDSSKKWRKTMKEDCNENSQEALAYLIYLKDRLSDAYHNKSVNKYKLAESRALGALQLNLYDSINSLNEAAQLYEEAAKHAREAHDALYTLNAISIARGVKDLERDAKRSAYLANIQTYQSSAANCRTEAAETDRQRFSNLQRIYENPFPT